MAKEITVFICEDDDTAREIVGKYLVAGKVTYAEMLPAENRSKVVEALEALEEPFMKV